MGVLHLDGQIQLVITRDVGAEVDRSFKRAGFHRDIVQGNFVAEAAPALGRVIEREPEAEVSLGRLASLRQCAAISKTRRGNGLVQMHAQQHRQRRRQQSIRNVLSPV